MNINNTIVTGETGAVSSAVVRKALERNISVTCIVHKGSKRLSSLPLGKEMKVVECDMAHYKSLHLDGIFDAFFHLSWEKTFGLFRDDAEVQMRNIQYTLDAVKLAYRCGCKVFLGAGS